MKAMKCNRKFIWMPVCQNLSSTVRRYWRRGMKFGLFISVYFSGFFNFNWVHDRSICFDHAMISLRKFFYSGYGHGHFF